MNPIIIVLLISVLLSLGGLITILVRCLQRMPTAADRANLEGLRARLQFGIDNSYARFAALFQQLIYRGYLYSLLAVRSLARGFRFILIMVERRCSHLIESFHGRRLQGKRGAVSLFLSKVKKF